MNTVNARAHCIRPIFTAIIALAIAFTFIACSSDDNGGNPPDPSGSSEEKVFCNLTAGTCSQMSLSACMELVNAGAAQIVANCTEPPPPPSSSSAVVILGYCDYGPLVTQANGEVTGGCFPMATADDEANCAAWGDVVTSCPTTQNSSSSLSFGFFDYGGQTYKTVKIGSQTWMAENLNYSVTGSECYEVSPVGLHPITSSCEKYGSLYSWATAMNLPSNCNTSTCASQVQAKHKGICPTGWHIPSEAEWDILMTAVGGSSTAGKKLKAKNDWDDNYNGQSGNGTDEYGFAALPGGYRSFGGGNNKTGFGTVGQWWGATENNTSAVLVHGRFMTNSDDKVNASNFIKQELSSVRCVQN